MTQRDGLKVGTDVPSMLANDLELEYAVAAGLKTAIVVCERERDVQTRTILEQHLRDTQEDHAYWLEQQLGLIETLGVPNYLHPRCTEKRSRGVPPRVRSPGARNAPQFQRWTAARCPRCAARGSTGGTAGSRQSPGA